MGSRGTSTARNDASTGKKPGLIERFGAWLNAGGTKRKAAAGGAAGVGAVALALTLSMVAGAADGVPINRDTLPEGTTAVADPETTATYTSFPDSNAVDLTSSAGQLWTDKSVWVSQDTGSTDAQGSIYGATIDGKEVGSYPVAESTFITGVSALTSSIKTNLVEPKPLDIVLVLDVSGSMDESYETGVRYNVYNNNTAPNTNTTNYYVLDNNGQYYQVNSNRNGQNPNYYYTASGAPHGRYYYTNNENTAGTYYNNNTD